MEEIKALISIMTKVSEKLERFLNKRTYKLDVIQIDNLTAKYHRKFFVLGLLTLDKELVNPEDYEIQNNLGNTAVIKTYGTVALTEKVLHEHWLNENDATIIGANSVNEDEKAKWKYAIIMFVDN